MIPTIMTIPKDQYAHAYWFEDGVLHHHKCGTDWHAAIDFVERAERRHVGAYATYPVNGRQRVLLAAFYGPLAKYGASDRVVLDCHWAHELVWPEIQKQKEREFFDMFTPSKANTTDSVKNPGWLLELQERFPEIEIKTTKDTSWFPGEYIEHNYINGIYTEYENGKYIYRVTWKDDWTQYDYEDKYVFTLEDAMRYKTFDDMIDDIDYERYEV